MSARDDALDVLERGAGGGQLAQRVQRARTRPAAPPPPPRGRVKNSPWKWLKPSTRQRWELLVRAHAGGHQLEPAEAGSAISACSSSSSRPRHAHLDHAAVRQQPVAAAVVVVDGHA